MRRLIVFFLFLVSVCVGTVAAQPAPVEYASMLPSEMGKKIYYAIEHGATVYSEPDESKAYLRLGFREPVYVLATEGEWSRIRTQDGARGYVKSSALSNVWIRISKRKKSLFLYRGVDLIVQFPADFGYNAYADKERRGSSANPDHWRTPEGVFFIVEKKPHSQFHKAFVLNYPTAEDARRGLKQGLISKEQHDAIIQAEANFTSPPMTTALGGMIEIHGDGTGASSNWTQGCVAIHNSHMEQIWSLVSAGTPVIIEK